MRATAFLDGSGAACSRLPPACEPRAGGGRLGNDPVKVPIRACNPAVTFFLISRVQFPAPSAIKETLKQGGTQVPLAGVGQYDDDRLARVLRTFGYPRGHRHRGPARNTRDYPLLACEAQRVFDRFLVGSRFNFVNQ